ncbi:MAG: YfiR family protein [Burkholderiaceae bacterium]|nr:YfiR family protein [Burkholderiaceae bacterium]
MKAWLRILGLAGCCAGQPLQAAPEMDEHQLKAAFVYRFAQYTAWPPPPLQNFAVCTAGQPPGLGEALQRLAGRRWSGVSTQVLSLERPEQARQCQLLVLGFAERTELRRWLAALDDGPVLVIADTPEGYRAGADIGLIQEPNGLAFRVNLSESRRRGLSLSSQMLKLAREVR